MENLSLNQTTNQIATTSTSASDTHHGLAMQSKPDQEGVTILTAPGPSLTTNAHSTPRTYTVQRGHDPLTMLGRPTVLATGAAVSDAQPGAAYTDTIGNEGPPMPLLSGVLGFRATICYRLEVAAAPQAQGIYRLCVERFPCGKGTRRCVTSTLPGVDLNIAEGSSATLKVPFVSDTEFWHLVNQPNDAGDMMGDNMSVYLTVYSPISWDTTTVSTPNWTLFRWFEDLDLIGQSTALSTIIPQGMDMKEEHTGAISSWMGFGARVAGALSVIPSLSSLAIPLRWAFSTGAKVASHFGYSKPYEGSGGGAMFMSYGRGLNTAADRDILQPMALYSNNEVATLSNMAGHDKDEMAFGYLTALPAMIAQFTWKASDVAGSLKWTCPVAPAAFWCQTSTGGFAQKLATVAGQATAATIEKQSFIPSPICYLASHFLLWRGGLCFRFKLGRTKFHAGKLLIGYIPASDIQTSAVTAGATTLGPAASTRIDYHSMIVDVRTTSEFDFMVPYTYHTAWCRTGMTVSGMAPGSTFPATGVLFVQALDTLYGPDNVPQTISITVEVMGCPDLEFAAPSASQLAPIYPGATPHPVIIAQGADPCPDRDGFNACADCIGERILSVKQLLARPLWSYFTIPNIATAYRGVDVIQATGTYATTPGYTVGPLTYKSPTYAPLNTVANYANVQAPPTIISSLSSMYALWRGGIVLRIIPALTSTSTRSNFTSHMSGRTAGLRDMRYSPLSVEATGPNMAKFPYYNKNSRSRTGYSHANGALPSPGPITSNIIPHLGIGGADTSGLMGVCAADDFQLSCFNGMPAVVFMDVPLTAAQAADPMLAYIPAVVAAA